MVSRALNSPIMQMQAVRLENTKGGVCFYTTVYKNNGRRKRKRKL